MSPAGAQAFPKWRWTGPVLALLCCCSAQLPEPLPRAAPDVEPDLEPEPEPGPAADAAPAVAPETPSREEEPGKPTFEQAMECRKRHCYPPASKCFATCYKYNHPNGPAHDDCDDGCRRSYDVLNCEAACARDRLAFEPVPATVPAKCRKGMARCRKASDPGTRGTCELACLLELRACESAAGPGTTTETD